MFSKTEKFILTILTTINFVHVLDFMIMMPLGPSLMRIFEISPQQFGFLVSTYTLFAGISGFFASIFLDKFDRKKSLLFFFVGFSLGTILCALSKSYILLLIARSMTGAFGGVLNSIVLSMVGDTFPEEKRGTSMGIVMGAFSIASIFGVPFSLLLADQYDWHSPFMFLGVFSAFVSILVALKFPNYSSHLKGKHLEDSDIFFSLKHIWKSNQQLIALAFLSSLIFGHFMVIPYISASYVSNGGLKESDLSLVYLTGGIASMIASPIIGRLSDKYGKILIFYFGAGISIIPILWITHLGFSSSFVVMVSSALFFLSMSARMVPAMAAITSVPSPRFRGSFMSICSCIQQFSAAITSLIAGAIIVKNDQGQLLNYEIVGYLAVVVTIISIFLAGFLKPAQHSKVSV